MKAYSINRYGNPDEVLRLVEVEPKQPKYKEVKLKVCATSINDYDWCITSGKPLSYRLIFGLFRPGKKMRIPGMELAGIVEQTGPGVTKFKVGDAVYGDISDHGFGSFAEYLCINENALSLKPDEMSFTDASSIPHAAMLAVQGLRDLGQICEGQKVLINGGGGGVGAFGVQLAKISHADVTGVDTGEKLEAMKTLGFDKVIDYKIEDFTEGKQQYDLILDCKTNRSIHKYLKVLKPKGKYISIGGQSGKLIQMLYLSPMLRLFSKKRVHMLMLKANTDLNYINQLYDTNKISCVIDGPYPFDMIPWAVQRFGDGLHHGKIVISLD
ncbi:MAG: NAD(P)-dependent alcohol dehydrogenase [Bacteroidales bacterium]|nr:NAD(P)-dependent alcohol dehydrogenase [Bacteroidales bacterium]